MCSKEVVLYKIMIKRQLNHSSKCEHSLLCKMEMDSPPQVRYIFYTFLEKKSNHCVVTFCIIKNSNGFLLFVIE